MVTTSSDIKHELKGSVDAMKKIIEEHGQRWSQALACPLRPVDTINKRVGQAEDALLHAAKVSSDAQNMNFDQLKEGQVPLRGVRQRCTDYE